MKAEILYTPIGEVGLRKEEYELCEKPTIKFLHDGITDVDTLTMVTNGYELIKIRTQSKIWLTLKDTKETQ